MSVRSVVAGGLVALAAILPSTRALPAQEVVDLPAGDRPLDADFEEVFRVGVMDGEPWETFGYVREVVFDANGNLYVFDALSFGGTLPDGRSYSAPSIEDTRVLVFDASGGFVRELGSRGEGPGEFNMPRDFAVTRDGTIVVYDLGHRAYQLFDPDGGFIRMVRAGLDGGNMLADPLGGGVFRGTFNGFGSTITSSGGGPPPQPPTSRPVVRMDLAGEEVRADTVIEGRLPPRDADAGDVSDRIDLQADVPEDVAADLRQSLATQFLASGPVFEPPFLVGVLPDGSMVHTDSSAYELWITPPGADEAARVIRRPLRPRPVTRAIRRDHASRGGRRSGTLQMTVAGDNPSTSVQGYTYEMPEREFYPEFAVLRRFSTTWEGRIWVRRRGEGWLDFGPIDVVTPDGRYVGSFPTDATRIPDAFGPDGMAAFIESNELGVANVVVRRLPAAVR